MTTADKSKLKRLHIGCGLNTPQEWINLDGSWNAWLAKFPRTRKILKSTPLAPKWLFEIEWSSEILIHDVRKPLPFPENSINAVYSSNLLEHLYLEEANKLLKECYRIIEPAGILRIVVPDLRSIIMEYLEERQDADKTEIEQKMNPAELFNQRLGMHPTKPKSGSFIYKLYSYFTGFHLHKWMYDADQLIECFHAAGFSDVGQMNMFQS